MAVIEGEFRRIARRKKKSQLSGSGSIGTDFWEATHPGEVQDENVHITGTNRTDAEDNPYYNALNPGLNTPVLPQWLSNIANDPLGNIQTLLFGAFVLFVIVPMITKDE